MKLCTMQSVREVAEEYTEYAVPECHARHSLYPETIGSHWTVIVSKQTEI
jgi:hypothetical protein